MRMSCVLCFQSTLRFEVLENKPSKIDCERMLACCNKYLSLKREEGINNFQWVYSEQVPVPFCSTCFQFSKELSRIEDELLNHVESFTQMVINRKQLSWKTFAGDNLLETEDINKEDDDLLKGIAGSSVLSNPEIQMQDIFDANKIKVETDPYEDSFQDFDVELPCSTSATSKACNNVPQLRVVLKRLKFDSRGKIVVPPLMKRKSAIAANALFRKQANTEYDIDCEPNSNRNCRRRQFVRRHENTEPVDFEEVDGDMTVKKSVKQKQKDRFLFKCAVCSTEFKHSKELDTHCEETGHITERNFECDKCPAKYYRSPDLHQHIRRSHINGMNSRDKNSFICSLCGFESETVKLMKQHKEATHYRRNRKRPSRGEREKCYECDKCEEKFLKAADLTAHKIRMHKMESPFKCSTCGKTFTTSRQLGKHAEMIHSENKSAASICELCGVSFKYRQSLTLHVKTIHEKRPKIRKVEEKGHFPCPHCGKVFIVDGRLQLHIKVVHLKLISFDCKVCGRSLANNVSLYTHMLMHKGKSYDCEICGRGFFKKVNLLTHTKRIHEQNKKPRKSYSKTPLVVVKDAVAFR